MTKNEPLLTLFLDGFCNFGICWWARTGPRFEYEDSFWEWLSMGWYDEYIYPYDDPYGVERVSYERKLRLGERDR